MEYNHYQAYHVFELNETSNPDLFTTEGNPAQTGAAGSLSRFNNADVPVPFNVPIHQGPVFQGQGGSVFCLVLVVSGQFILTEHQYPTGGHRYQVLGPSTVLCYRHVDGRSIIADAGARGYLIQFDQSLVDRAQDSCSLRKSAFYSVSDDQVSHTIDGSEMTRFELLAKMLLERPVTNRPISKDIIRCVIDLLLMLFVKNANSDGVLEKSGNRVREQFYNLLEDEFRTEKKVSGYAKKLFVTANYLNRVMKLETGHTASYHIRKRVTTEALRQAQVLAASAKETAYSLGFSDIAHFSKYFKKETGLTFTSFRQKRHHCLEAA